MLLLAVPTYQDIFSLFSIIAVVIYSIGIWQNNLTITRVIEVISCLLFIVYNLAISGLISTIIELLAALIAIFRLDIKKAK